MRTLLLRSGEIDPDAITEAYRELAEEAWSSLAAEGIAPETATFSRLADLRYSGQAYELTIRVPEGRVDVAGLIEAFAAEHERTYGHGSLDDPVDLVSIRMLARVVGDGAGAIRLASDAPAAADAPSPAAPTSALTWERSTFPWSGGRRSRRASPRGRSSSTSTTRPPSSRRAAPRPSMPSAASTSMSTEPVSPNRLATDPLTLEVIKNALGSVADEMALMVMRSAYSPVVRDTMDYSTALCDRHGQVVAQGLTLAVQLGTFPTAMRYVLEEYGQSAQPGDVYLDERSVRLRRPASAGHLRDQADLRRRRARGLGGDDGASLRRRRASPPAASLSTRPRSTRRACACRCSSSSTRDARTPPSSASSRRTRASRCSVLGDLRAQVAACRAGERGLTDILRRYGAAAARDYMDELQRLGERLMRAEIAALPDGEYGFVDWIDGVGEDPEPLRIEVLAPGRGRRALDRLHRHRAAGRGERQLPGRPRIRRLLLRDQGDRGARDPELRGLHAPDPDQRARGDDRQPCAARRLRGARRDRLPGLRRDHRGARGRSSRPGDRGRRGRSDADRLRRLRERPSVRDDRGPGRHVGRAGRQGRARGSLEPARQPLEPAGRAARGRPAARGDPVRPRPRLGRAGALPRRARIRAGVPGTRASAPC